MFDPPATNYSGIDTVPGLAQAKIAFQWVVGDDKGARRTLQNFATYSLGASQLHSVFDWATGQRERAAERQREFARGAARLAAAIPESAPVLGQFLGAAHCCCGNPQRGSAALKRSTRSCGVLAVGGATWCVASRAAAPAVFAPSTGLHVAGVVAAAAGIAVGLAADAFWFSSEPIPRPMTPGERFDWMALRLLDGLRGVSGMDLAAVLSPEHVTHVSIWTEPISASDVARLMAGHNDLKAPAVLDHISSGVFHAYALIKTDKGRLLVTERVHDGRVLVEDLGAGSMVPFVGGHQLHAEALNTLDRAARHASAHAGPAAVHPVFAGGAVGHGSLAAHGPPAASGTMALGAHGLQAAREPAAGAAVLPLSSLPEAPDLSHIELFAAKDVAHGHSVASVAQLARAQSTVGYNVLKSNCQHYVDSVFKFVGGSSLPSLPNEEWLSIFRAIWPPKSLRVPAGTLAGEIAWNVQQAPLRAAVAGAVALCPSSLAPERGPGAADPSAGSSTGLVQEREPGVAGGAPDGRRVVREHERAMVNPLF